MRRCAWVPLLALAACEAVPAEGSDAGRTDIAVTADAVVADMPPPKEPYDGGPLETPVPQGFPDGGTLPPINAVWRVATHNSYWVHRSETPDLFASGTQERLLDQLLFNHVRGVEIDVHKAPADGAFEVYHTARGLNSVCNQLDECVRTLRFFHDALPRHELVTIVVELKELSAYNFDATHTPDDLDRAFRTVLGDAMFTPRDLLARCPAAMTLRDCVRTHGWPRVDELRGRFLLAVLGNWRNDLTVATCLATHPPEQCPARATDAVLGHGPAGWVTYATAATSERAGFAMASNFVHFNGSPAEETVDAATLARAYDASVLEQVENLADPEAPGFLAAGGIVRGADSFAIRDQGARISAGFQLVQTDHPWLQFDDRGPAQPFRAMPGSGFHGPIVEPGERLLLRGPADVTRFAFAHRAATESGCVAWTTTPSTTRTPTDAMYAGSSRGGAVVCLRASADPDDDRADSFSLCRETLADQTDRAFTRVLRSGVERISAEIAGDGVADALTLEVCGTTVRARVRGALATAERALTPDGGVVFAATLPHQGLAATRDALFVQTRRNGQPVHGNDLQISVPGNPARHDAVLLDLSSP